VHSTLRLLLITYCIVKYHEAEETQEAQEAQQAVYTLTDWIDKILLSNPQKH
jgi:hypothetical protein